MKYNITIPDSVQSIIQRLEEHGYEAYIVGGCVRDSILGRIPHDYDICTSAKPEEMMEMFSNEKIIPTGLQHGTLTIVMNNEPYEVTTFRIDGEYSDNRRPDKVSFTHNLVEDLERRDFTINAIAYNQRTGFIDPFNGLKDIENKTMRCVGNPIDRFSEDALRILRLWRFCIQLDFYSTDSTSNAAITLKDNLKNVSYERIQAEFVKALQCNKVNFATQPDWYLEVIIPEWKDMHFEQNNPWHCYDVANHSLAAYENLGNESDLITRIATLLHDIGKPHCYQDDTDGTRHFKGHGKVSADMVYKILKRLRFDNYTIDKTVELVHYHDATFEESRKSVKRWLNKIGEEQFRRLIKLRSADIQAQSDKNMKERLDKLDRILNILDNVLTEQSCFQIKDLAINGHDLIACGVPEGKLIGHILKSLLDMVIEDNVQNNRDELFKAINGLFAANPQLYVTNNGKH